MAFQGKHTIADPGFGNINPYHKFRPLNTFDLPFCQGCGREKDKDGVGVVVGVVGPSDRVRVGDSDWVKVGASDGIRVRASDLAGHPWFGVAGPWPPSSLLWLQIVKVGVRVLEVKTRLKVERVKRQCLMKPE